jgi:DNA (cytosine-5)-methyltransferase 1
MATSKKSTGKKSKNQTSSVGVTHVSLSVRQVSGEVKKIRGICGHGSEQPLANYDQDTQSWKMYGDISLWGDCPLLVNLPVSGMTQNGVLFLQHPWEPITGETASSLWPTPVASSSMDEDIKTVKARLESGTIYKSRLIEAVAMWPTPVASDAWTGDLKSTQQTEGSRHSLNLSTAVQKYPTMSASGMGNTGSQQMLQKHVDLGSLTEEEKRGMTAGNGGRLNPTWVEWLMGFPTGWTDLED